MIHAPRSTPSPNICVALALAIELTFACSEPEATSGDGEPSPHSTLSEDSSDPLDLDSGHASGDPTLPAAPRGDEPNAETGTLCEDGQSSDDMTSEVGATEAPPDVVATELSEAGAPEVAPSADDTAAPAASEDTAAELEACIVYALAQCHRRFECDAQGATAAEIDAACHGSAEFCPDALFSPGSTRELAGVVACAEQWRTFDCAQVAAGERPSCATLGTRKRGEACSYPTQCETDDCSGSQTECGVCVTLATDADDCRLAGFTCPAATSCGETGKCEPLPGPVDARTYADGMQQEGDPCYQETDCAEPYSCLPNAAGARCAAPVELGESCAGTEDCLGYDALCAEATGVCEPRRLEGEECRAELGEVRFGCASGLVCDRVLEPPLCVTLPVESERCVLIEVLGGYVCEEGYTCELSTQPPTCRVAADGEPQLVPVGDASQPLAPEPSGLQGGDPCASDTECASPNYCLCASAECETHVCATFALPAESCTDPGVVCHTATRCEDGRCVITGRESVFATLCGE